MYAGNCLLITGWFIIAISLVVGGLYWYSFQHPSPYRVEFVERDEGRCDRGEPYEPLIVDRRNGKVVVCDESYAVPKWTKREYGQVVDLTTSLAKGDGLGAEDQATIRNTIHRMGAAHGYPRKFHIGPVGVATGVIFAVGVSVALIGRRLFQHSSSPPWETHLSG
ncbi:hypothetical protein [Actinomadura rubrisoli]|uniref:Uncharacterized protein n=1 Tax=Actinomadura rubrisoli TaxID=2530368 RepID=A0A4R5B677_9ACTN|nr:hypothetical protein [Actinomadura rubrisoli]TDD80359.1 hypothetical protein E1298_25975 [Actinomadura rubrisoli]